jgi:hypothetical protein
VAIKLVVNSAWRDAIRILVTDNSDVASSDGDKITNVTTGPRHLEWTQSGTSARRIVYHNGDGGIDYDTFIVTRADRLNTHSVKIIEWTAYTATSSNEFSTTTFAETLVGAQSTDWVYEPASAVTGLEALGLETDAGTGGAFTATLNKVYAGTSIELENPVSAGTQPVDRTTRIVLDTKSYQVDELLTLTFKHVTSAQVESIRNLYQIHTEPFFVYDQEDNWVPYKLYHCVFAGAPVTQVFDDLYNMTLNLARVRLYNNT